MAELPEHHRVVFVLREMEGKTYEEISEITGVTLGTVKSRLNRARNKFAQIVAPDARVVGERRLPTSRHALKGGPEGRPFCWNPPCPNE